MEKHKALYQLFSNLWILFFESRNAHWNITGPNFKPLHEFFAEIYTKADSDADLVAERLRQLGKFIPSNFAIISKNTTIPESTKILSSSKSCLDRLISIHQLINKQIVEIIQECDKDEATKNMLADMVEKMEVNLWKLQSSL